MGADSFQHVDVEDFPHFIPIINEYGKALEMEFFLFL